MTDLALDLTDVAKVYPGKVHALRGIEMRVGRGEVFGLLGPNGAGKSTLVKILMTVIRPTRVSGTVLGKPVGNKQVLSQVGYLPEHHEFPDYLKGRQMLDFFAALSGVPKAERKRRIGSMLELVGMEKWAEKKVGGYSKGMRQRLGIAQALMADPQLVLLDEPTDGVDPSGRRDIRDIVARLRDEGKTVFLNSHLLSELEMVCDRVAIMVQGQIHSQGTLDELTAEQRVYEMQVLPEAEAVLRTAAEGIPAEWTLESSVLSVSTQDAGLMQPVIDAVRAAGQPVLRVQAKRPSLEDLFLQAVLDPETGRSRAPGAAEMPNPSKGAAS